MARAKKCPRPEPVAGKGTAATAWDYEVDRARLHSNVNQETATDKVIISWLNDGDTRPLADFLLRGHIPGPDLRFFLALTLMGPDTHKTLPKKLPAFQLVPHRRKGKPGDRINREIKLRDIEIARFLQSFSKLMGSKEAAITRVREIWRERGVLVSKKIVERAYSKYVVHRSTD